jgi:hypothetical protein
MRTRFRGSRRALSPISLISLIASALTGLAACGAPSSSDSSGSLTSFPSTPLQTVTSSTGALSIEVRTGPEQPPPLGQSAAQLTVEDATTLAPVDGLDLTVVPWMPAMGHGSSVSPTVTPMGGGVYLVTNLYLYMPGTWQLRTTLVGQGTDSVTPEFTVQ